MNVESLRTYCLSKKGSTESFPFNEDVLAFKVMDKIFLLVDLSVPESINLKCDPGYAIELRESYPQIVPGFHMNKKHWNTVHLDGLDDGFILSLIDHSYECVLKSLPAKMRTALNE